MSIKKCSGDLSLQEKKQKRAAKAKAKGKGKTASKGRGKGGGGGRARGVKRCLDLDAVDLEENDDLADPQMQSEPSEIQLGPSSEIQLEPQHVAEGEDSTGRADADAPVIAEEQVAVAEEQVAVAEEQTAMVELTLPMKSEENTELIVEKTEIEESAPSSSSGAAAVPPLESGDGPVDGPAEISESAADRISGPRVYSTPDILQRLEPCGIFKIRLDFNALRFQLETKVKESDPRWLGQKIKSQKTFSKSFNSTGDWEFALGEVHRHMWDKFNLTKDRWPLKENMEEQCPGEIPADVISDLKPIMDTMPAATIYAKSKK